MDTTIQKKSDQIGYKYNPFLTKIDGSERLDVSITRRQRLVAAVNEQGEEMSRELYITEENNSVISTFLETSIVDDEQFLKIYTKYISRWLFQLKPSTYVVLCVIFRVYQKTPNTDSIYLTYRKAVEDYGYKSTKATFYNALKDLKKVGLLADRDIPSWYWINPLYIFNGNRIEFAKVVKRRNANYQQLKLFTKEEAA